MKSSAIQFIRSARFKLQLNLREVHKVTERKSGAIYRTRSLGFIICTPEYSSLLFTPDKSIGIGPVSTSISRQLL